MVVPRSNAETRAVAVKHLGSEPSSVPKSMRGHMLDIWLSGIITQITSLPTCVTIRKIDSAGISGVERRAATVFERGREADSLRLSKEVEPLPPEDDVSHQQLDTRIKPTPE